jgi:amino acid transporter
MNSFFFSSNISFTFVLSYTSQSGAFFLSAFSSFIRKQQKKIHHCFISHLNLFGFFLQTMKTETFFQSFKHFDNKKKSRWEAKKKRKTQILHKLKITPVLIFIVFFFNGRRRKKIISFLKIILCALFLICFFCLILGLKHLKFFFSTAFVCIDLDLIDKIHWWGFGVIFVN